ncbi:glycosyltransferase [Amylibacter sp.]|nr:glycosyltransferase [Amylibacter sp.]MDC1532083.1 glycosyltransferase [Amylibacter sp.]
MLIEKMKKTILLISINTSNYGAERSLVLLANFINENSIFSSLVIIPKNDLIVSLLEEKKIDYIIHPFQGNVNFGGGTKLIRGLTKYFINYVSSHGLKFFLKNQGYKIALVHTNTITTDFGSHLSSRFGIKHVWHIREMAKSAFGFDFELGDKYIRKMTAKSAKIICNSNTVNKYYTNTLGRNDLVTIYNGVSLTKENVKNNKLCRKKQKFKIIMVGRLSHEKDQKSAIRACAHLLSKKREYFTFDIWGDGPDYDDLLVLIKELNLQNHVNLKGYSNSIPFIDYSVGVSCGEHEAFGRSTVEYMLANLPVVGIDSGANQELINSKTGIFYSIGDIKQFGEALIKLYDDSKLRIEMGQCGRLQAEEKYSEDSYGDKILGVYHDVIK